VAAAQSQQQLELVVAGHSDVVVVNGRCELHEEEGVCIVVVAGVPVFRFARESQVERALFAVQALAAGYAAADEIASALGLSRRTVFRYQELYRQGGALALIPKKPGRPTGQNLDAAQLAAIKKWHEADVSGREIARRLKCAPGVVQTALRRLGLPPRRSAGQQRSLFAGPDDAEPEPACDPVAEPASAEVAPLRHLPSAGRFAHAVDPSDRGLDRLLASQGLLEDAAPVFEAGRAVPRLGVLLALPLLVSSGLFEESERLYGSIGPAFYGLRTSLLVLVLMALLRVKHPESLKEYSPRDFGRVVGLDRAPEVKTLRRKLDRLAAGPMEALLQVLAKRRVEAHDDLMGFLYVDGHVRVYSGKHRLPKTHVARIRLSAPAVQEVWVNDSRGDPLFFVTQEAHPQLVSALPVVLEQARELVGDDRRLTVVFDRGGWSPRLFGVLAASGFDVITYRKGKTEAVPHEDFAEHPAPGTGGSVRWLLHQRSVRVGSPRDRLWMRQVTRLKGEHQTHILTTRQDLEITEVAHRMFSRWRQENFLKYMRQEFALDSLVEYGTIEDDPLRDLPNPAWRVADKQYKKLRGRLRTLKARYAEEKLAGSEVPQELRDELDALQVATDEQQAARNALPARVTVAELDGDQKPVCLPARRKNLSDGLKMLAYQVESDLVRLVEPHYKRASDEGRTLVSAALRTAGEIELGEGELRLTLDPQSSPHRTRAISELCKQLNATETRFPGTELRIRYRIRGVTGDTRT
jgi:transposase